MSANHINHYLMRNAHMNLSQLQSFVALAETSSFTEAAYAVDLTQSAVSHALATLESELGVTLLERNRKGVVALTEAGRAIIPHARALLASASAIEQEARAVQGRAMGKVRLGSIESIVPPRLLAGVMTSFRTAYPEIEVVLFEGAMHEVGEWIEKSVIDVGFVVLPAPGIESTLITTDELCILVSPAHRLHAKDVVTANDLREEGFIMEKTQCTLNFLGRVGVEPSRAKLSVRYEASDSATILAMVREGLGITLVPRQMLPKKLEGVVALALDPPRPLQIGLAVRSQAMASPAAKLFIQTAQAWTQEQSLVRAH
jgi:DNA-binding transcriptional LysR family regulator